jgi:hypothetical protein
MTEPNTLTIFILTCPMFLLYLMLFYFWFQDKKRQAYLKQFSVEYRLERLDTTEEWADASAWFNHDTRQFFIYEKGKEWGKDVAFKMDARALRGYWLIAADEVWLDVQIKQEWQVLKLKMDAEALKIFSYNMETFANAMLLQAHEANHYFMPRFTQGDEVQQELTGEWTSLASRNLYLNPNHLLVLSSWGGEVKRMIPSQHIEEIDAIPRMDAAGTGILRFRVEDERLAFAIPDYEEWAMTLAQVASKAQGTELDLEIMELKKKKNEEG